MKISEQWLREWVDPRLNSRQLAEQLTMAGMEVESIDRVAIQFSGVVVACIETLKPHPDADGLTICQVDDGTGKSLNIICGASNVKTGMHVALAKAGAKLPGGKSISSTEIKGISSHGMLCSAAELELGEAADGILELPADTCPGQDMAELFSSKDTVIDISLTPNRGDCLSINGIAREVAVLNNFIFHYPEQDDVPATIKTKRTVKLKSPDACPHYVGRVIEDVNLSTPAPLWLTEKLRRCGIRSINPVVDITNYVMLEYGQPMHAFDNDKLDGDIFVRYASDNEKLILLDQQEVQLGNNTLVIADKKNVLAMAGIMGGMDSAVTETSRNIFLESAFFNPDAVLGEARRFGMHTESSHRFERGVDPDLQLCACERATQLILDICGGKPGPVTEAISKKHIPANPSITLQLAQVNRVLGINIDPDEISEILQGLGMDIKREKDSWQVTAPTYRFDISIEADLIEEIARIYGYDRIPDQSVSATLNYQTTDYLQQQLRNMCLFLVHQGYQEAITYSFVNSELQDLLDPDNQALDLSNPIATDMAAMRTSLWPGLIQAVLYNVNRQQGRVRLFESGLVFQKVGGAISQNPRLGGLIYGNIHKKQWGIVDKECDIFDIKGDIEGLLAVSAPNTDIKFKSISCQSLHPGQSGEIIINNQSVGIFGALHPTIQQKLELAQPVYLFELEISRFSQHLDPKYQKLSKFPAVRRDLAIIVDETVPVQEVLESIGKKATDVLKNLELFDVYQGEGIDLGKKSLALGLTFQRSSSTLTDGEIENLVGEILKILQTQFGATLRE